MRLCEVCLSPLTSEDIGDVCTTCFGDWERHQAAKDAEWWEGE